MDKQEKSKFRSAPQWAYQPYQPADKTVAFPFITLMSPSERSITIEWLDDRVCDYEVVVRPAEGEDGEEVRSFTSTRRITVNGLSCDKAYTVSVYGDGRVGEAAPFRTGDYKGTVVNYLHPDDTKYEFSGRFLCSPSVVRHNGDIYVSMDVYKAGAPQNLSLLFRSRDDGKTFSYVTDLFPCFWGTLFSHGGCLYMIGTSTEYGDLLIGRSCDGGVSWEGPSVLYRGAGNVNFCGIHKAPVPVLEHDGRIWIAVEWGTWNKKCFMAGAFSAPANGDLLNVDEWTCTGFVRHDMQWQGAKSVFGGLEGNLVAQGDYIYNVLRYVTGLALILRIDPKNPGCPPQFVRVADFPSAHAKFEIRQYGESYYMVGNRLPLRNILSLYKSDDLLSWRLLTDVVDCGEMPEQEVGFQYPAFFMEGNTFYIVSRTAINGAANFHDTNCITFHKITVDTESEE